MYAVYLYGCFLKWWYPQKHPKMIIFSRKTQGFVGETHHFRKPQYINIHFLTTFLNCIPFNKFKLSPEFSFVFPGEAKQHICSGTHFLRIHGDCTLDASPSWIFTPPTKVHACALNKGNISTGNTSNHWFQETCFPGSIIGKQMPFCRKDMFVEIPRKKDIQVHRSFIHHKNAWKSNLSLNLQICQVYRKGVPCCNMTLLIFVAAYPPWD